MKTYLYPNGKTGTKRVTDMTQEEYEEAMTPKLLTPAERRKERVEYYLGQAKQFVLIPWHLAGLGMLSAILFVDVLLEMARTGRVK